MQNENVEKKSILILDQHEIMMILDHHEIMNAKIT